MGYSARKSPGVTHCWYKSRTRIAGKEQKHLGKEEFAGVMRCPNTLYLSRQHTCGIRTKCEAKLRGTRGTAHTALFCAPAQNFNPLSWRAEVCPLLRTEPQLLTSTKSCCFAVHIRRWGIHTYIPEILTVTTDSLCLKETCTTLHPCCPYGDKWSGRFMLLLICGSTKPALMASFGYFTDFHFTWSAVHTALVL